MRQRLRNLGTGMLLAAGLAGGCRSASVERAYPPDPLLRFKKPVEGKVVSTAPLVVAQAEPAAPEIPPAVLAAASSRSRLVWSQPPEVPPPPLANARGSLAAQEVPSRLVSTPKERVAASQAVRQRAPAVAPAPDRPQPAVPYGHAPDYRWLRGVLDRHYHGHMDLRYCDPSVEDIWGGKVRLEDDPRLAEFQEGDVVLVEGELAPGSGQPRAGNWGNYPRYRIHTIQLIERRR